MSSPLKRVGDLELEENLSYQRRAWLVQRIAFPIFGLILVAALFGLFGRGGFSHQRKTSPEGAITLEYERFLHLDSPESLKLRIRHPGQEDALELWIANSYLESVQVQQVTPQPLVARAETDRFVYRFSAPRSNSAVLVKFNLQPEKPGSLSGLLGLGSGSSLSFQQFVYP